MAQGAFAASSAAAGGRLLVGFVLLSLNGELSGALARDCHARGLMTASSIEPWAWFALAGLGLFHGINPAMGWLFAVALGLNRGSARIVWLSLLPIGLGHALAIALVLFVVLALGLVL